MVFSQSYSSDQQVFREVVRDWLQINAPKNLDIPNDGSPLAPEIQKIVKEFRREVGSKGWLAPAWPKEYGGGALSPALAVVIQEEMGHLGLPSMGDNYRWIPALMGWGAEEQKRRYIVPSLRGETITWQAFNEPQSGSDLSAVKTRAYDEGDHYSITGEKSFITGRFDPDYLFTLAVTDERRPPRSNLGVFMMDAHLPGINIKNQRLLMGSERRVYLDRVRVAKDCLIGSSYQGWEIAQMVLEGERGGPGFRVNSEDTVDHILQFLKEQRGQ